MNDSEALKNKYESIGLTADYNSTTSDRNLRELEIDTAMDYLYDGCKVLDVGCGLGFASIQYAARKKVEVHGLDYAENMVKMAKELLERSNQELKGSINFVQGSVTEIPFADNSFDAVISAHCLMALLDWELQKIALKEIHRVLKPGGVLVLMEGTFEGLEKLNSMRKCFELEVIAADGKDRLHTLKFHEDQLLDFCKAMYEHDCTKRFGMYYFLTRIVQPLLMAPDKPSYSHKINNVAREICRLIPDYEGLGHLVAFVFLKRR